MNDQSKQAGERNSLVCQPTQLYRLQQERYQLLVEQAVDGFYETDRFGTLTFFNDALCKIFGRTRPEMQHHKFWDFMDKENARSAALNFSRIGAAEQATKVTWTIKHKNGQPHTLDVSLLPITGAKGEHSGFRGMIHDVTNKMNAQKAMLHSRKKIKQLYTASQEAERRYRAFLKFLPLPLLVHNLDFSVAYLNPAFEATFGWTREDLLRNPIAHIPPDEIRTTRTGKLQLLQNGALSGLETKRLTKDGRTLEVINDSAVFYDGDHQPAGLVVALRDITQSKQDARISRSLFKIAEALHHYRDLDSLLAFITQQVQSLLQVERAHIILVDEDRMEYYFRAGAVQDSESYQTFSEIRVPLDDTFLAGQVILTGQPRIVNDMEKANVQRIVPGKNLHNLLGVPMELGIRIIGTMVATNKVDGHFNQDDVALLNSIARMVSLPIENARINDALRNSYEEIQVLNRAKDRIIEHLSHELRTPLSVLSASLAMLTGDACPAPETAARILARCQRNLGRITDMQSKIVDITRNPDRQAHQTMTALLERCADELESLADEELGPAAGRRLRRRIDGLFKHRERATRRIVLGPFISEEIKRLKPEFAHRKLEVDEDIRENAGHVTLPSEVLKQIFAGLVRNAVEYTPDGGKISITVRGGGDGPELAVADTGVGITGDNQQLIFGNYFTTADISRYGTGKPYDFNAGGTGFDLLRMHVFAEQYGFTISLDSKRCPHIPTDSDICPGSTDACVYCDTPDHCHGSGGTRFTLTFGKGKGAATPPKPWIEKDGLEA